MAQKNKLVTQLGALNLNNHKITGLATPVATTDAATKAYVDSSATVGTITSGTWHGSTITVPYGGTGATSLTANSILLGNGTSAITASGMSFASTTLSLGTGNGISIDGPVQYTKVLFAAQSNNGSTTGSALTGYQGLILTGSSVANYTVTLPAASNGQIFTLSSVGGVSGTFTLNASGSDTFATTPPTTLTAAQVLKYIYRSSDTKWYNFS